MALPTAGIGATNRNHALRDVEPEKQTLSPRHREMSGHPESRGNFSGGSLNLQARMEALISRCRHGCHNTQDRRHNQDFRKTFSSRR